MWRRSTLISRQHKYFTASVARQSHPNRVEDNTAEKGNRCLMNQPNEQRPPRERRRWELLIVPLAALILLALSGRSNTGPPAWSCVLDALHVHDRLRYTELAIFALCLIAVIAIARAGRNR